MNFTKKLRIAGLAAILSFGLSTQASAAPLPFTVNPLNAYGAGPGPFTADSIAGVASTLVTLETGGAGTTTSAGHGWASFGNYTLGGLPAGAGGIGSIYDLAGEFSYTTSYNSGTYGAAGNQNFVNTLHIELYADSTIGGMTFVAATVAGQDATLTLSGTSMLVGSGDLVVTGVADINALGGTAFNTTTDFTLTAFGSTLFTAPIPFHNLAFEQFNNTSQGVDLGGLASAGGTGYIAINSTGSIDFNSVPEPTTLALLGLGLLGFSLSRKRKI